MMSHPSVAEKQRKHSHYFRDTRHLDSIDVYRVLELFNITDQKIGHAIKKLLVAGGRGHKDVSKDIQEAIDSLERWKEMKKEDDPQSSLIEGFGHAHRSIVDQALDAVFGADERSASGDMTGIAILQSGGMISGIGPITDQAGGQALGRWGDGTSFLKGVGRPGSTAAEQRSVPRSQIMASPWINLIGHATKPDELLDDQLVKVKFRSGGEAILAVRDVIWHGVTAYQVFNLG